MLSLLHHTTTLYHSLRHLSALFDDFRYDNMSSSTTHTLAAETCEHLRARLPAHLARPRVGIVCGSGLGGLRECVNGYQAFAEGKEGGADEVVAWEYADVVNFPVSTVPGHEGRLIFGTMGADRVPVVLLVGRAHFYEGHDMPVVTFATRVCALLGVKAMLLTNAAGGLNPDYSVGDIVCLNDHINIAGLAGFHPLRGPNADDFGVRFPPLSDAYDMELRRTAHRTFEKVRKANPSGRRMHEGVYAFVGGPSYETRAECRMLRSFGADVVGMSTVPEIIAARHSGLKVLAFSLVTNNAVLEPTVAANDPKVREMSSEELAEFMSRGKADHTEVLHAGRQAAIDMQGLVLGIVSTL